MVVGYMRISTNGDRQILDLQRDVLFAAGLLARKKLAETPLCVGLFPMRPAWRSVLHRHSERI